jgi:hypothetical protein
MGRNGMELGRTPRRFGRASGVALCCALMLAAVGCTGSGANQNGSAASSSTTAPAEKPAESRPATEQPKYTKWIVYINDDASASKGGIKYSIALNLTATNPSADPSGKYTGSATAHTTSTGNIGGQQLNASAIANSSKLAFTLKATEGSGEPDVTDEGIPLASLVPEQTSYYGTGTIAMKAAGSGTIGRAGGSFSNNSAQKITLAGAGSNITLSVKIEGHTYDFKGTIRGEE